MRPSYKLAKGDKMQEQKEAQEQKLNLYQKLIEVRKSLSYFKKDTTGYKFQYVAGSKILAHLRTKIDELGLLLVPQIEKSELRSDNKGYVVEAKLTYRWVDAENPEDTLDVKFAGYGKQTDPAQAFGSLLTYSERYFLKKFFQIPTDDLDPDAFQGENGATDTDSNTQTTEDKKSQDSSVGQQVYKKASNLFGDEELESFVERLHTRFSVEADKKLAGTLSQAEWSEALELLNSEEFVTEIKKEEDAGQDDDQHL